MSTSRLLQADDESVPICIVYQVLICKSIRLQRFVLGLFYLLYI